MRLHGYCHGCHKVRMVRASSQELALAASGRIVQGECDDCEARRLHPKTPDCPHHECRNPAKCRGVRCFYQPGR